jgi:hypothetical protein
VTILARLQITPAADRRDSPRRQLRLGSTLQTSGEDVTIHDLSSTGMLIETAAQLTPFDNLEIELPEAGTAQALVVWSSGFFYGCEFKNRLSQAAVSAAQLRSPALQSSPPAPGLAQPLPAPAAEGQRVEDFDASVATDEDKAPLGVRLRVIFGSALILWALIIWGVASLVGLIVR